MRISFKVWFVFFCISLVNGVYNVCSEIKQKKNKYLFVEDQIEFSFEIVSSSTAVQNGLCLRQSFR